MSPNSLVIRGGRVIDPSQNIDAVLDVVVRDGKIDSLVDCYENANLRELDAAGCIVAPGLIDLHVHLRVPGQEHKESLATGSAAAAAGGFTTICCMPNTDPPLDNVDVIEALKSRIISEAVVHVLPIATISLNRAGNDPVDYVALAATGVIGFTDDGSSARSSLTMRKVLEASRDLGLLVLVHCEDEWLAKGHMHEGEVSRALGIAGIPAEAEEIIIARDLLLAGLTGGKLHIQHVSTARGIDMIRRAKSAGVDVTAEVMPHHLVMTDAWVAGDRGMVNVDEPAGLPGKPADPNTKVNPPLRPARDAYALLNALQSGDFDVIATDHAPHAADEKARPFDAAPMGLSGLELALPIGLALVRAGHLTYKDLIYRMSTRPAQMLNTPLAKSSGTLAIGAPADITTFDPDREWTVIPDELQTMSKNTPLLGMTLKGRTIATIISGEIRFEC